MASLSDIVADLIAHLFVFPNYHRLLECLYWNSHKSRNFLATSKV